MIITSGGIGQYVTIRAWSADGRLQADHPVGRLGKPLHCVPAAHYVAAAGLHACSSSRCCCRHAAAAWGSCSMGAGSAGSAHLRGWHQCLVEVCLHAVTCGTSTPSVLPAHCAQGKTAAEKLPAVYSTPLLASPCHRNGGVRTPGAPNPAQLPSIIETPCAGPLLQVLQGACAWWPPWWT